MKVESATIVILTMCIFLSFYLTLLSFQAIDDTLKKQLVTLAAYSLITGVVILVTLMVHLGIKKAFSRVNDQLIQSEEPPEHKKA